MTEAIRSAARFRVTGMTCQNCVRNAGDAVRAVPGVADVMIDLATGTAAVRWQANVADDSPAVIAALRRAGFNAARAEPATPSETAGEAGCGCAATPPPGRRAGFPGWGLNLAVGIPVTAALILGEWVLGWGAQRWFQWLACGLALPVQIVCGARFYRGAWMQLKAGRSNMDTLVALGSTTAFGFSAWGLFAGGQAHLYFLEAAAIITLISLGHWLEARATAQAAGALRGLMDLAPPTARWLSASGVETEVPVARLQPDDRVLLKPGDRISVDGEVLEGESAVDESMLTGESLPVDKQPGANLYAGTVNQNGRLVVRVSATGEATALAHIIAVVQRAQNSRADIQRLADRVSSVFVPIVILVAIATGLWWGLAPDHARAWHGALAGWLWHATPPVDPLAAAFIHAAAVLIVACPCAMGLATPAAIMAGANAAARRGILIRDGTALEKSGRITAIAFDKTGTLTSGRVRVAAQRDLRPDDRRGPPLEQLAAALASSSTHPLSVAIASLRPPPVGDLPLSDWKEIRGRGVQARLDGGWLRLGSLDWLREAAGVDLQGSAWVAEWAGQGATVVGLAREGVPLGLFALNDAVKPDAARMVAGLQAAGLEAYLMTGDSAPTAAAVAAQVGIETANVFAGARPGAKAELIQQLQRRGLRVAFVGDGINDAPALEQADLGIAVGRASDVAREAADLTLLRSDIEVIPEALGLAQATLRTIRQNLFWAFFYNAAAVPLAALGFLSPVICAATMGLSDVLVIGNALRLTRWRNASRVEAVAGPRRKTKTAAR